MQLQDVLAELEAAGTAQNQKIYRRHGVQNDLYGVSYANLNALRKRIRTDHDLARALWETGNHDARVLATKIANPKQADNALLDRWVSDLGNYVIADALSDYASRTPLARQKMEAWTPVDDEWISTVGWNLMAHLAMKDHSLPDAYFEPYITAIQQDIHNRPNRTRYAMNGALIAIGMRSATLEARAITAAEQIGAVDVDHGETGCKTPDAADYIRKGAERRRAKAKV